MNEMNMPLISVIIPVYNAERFVAQTIDSVRSQTYTNLEIIAIDDCSEDNSLQILKSYAQLDKRIRIIVNAENLGVAKTRNNGIQAATGEYIALLDGDDVWECDKLERQIVLIQREEADIVYCSLDFIDEENHTIKHPFIVPRVTNYKKMLVKCVFTCSTIMVRSDLLKSHPFQSNYYHEDFLLWMELLSLSVKACGDTKILMHNRQVKGSRSNNKLHAAKERWKIYRNALHLKFFPALGVFCLYAFYGALKYF